MEVRLCFFLNTEYSDTGFIYILIWLFLFLFYPLIPEVNAAPGKEVRRRHFHHFSHSVFIEPQITPYLHEMASVELLRPALPVEDADRRFGSREAAPLRVRIAIFDK